jgi:hypothetical protein
VIFRASRAYEKVHPFAMPKLPAARAKP